MEAINRAKAGLPALLFLSAVIILLAGEYGVLTVPGLVAAVIGIVCVFKLRNIAALLGIAAATCSFVGQYLVAYCPYCFAAALTFALAGTLCLLETAKTKPQWSLILIPMMISIVLFSTSFLPHDTRTENINSEPSLYPATTVSGAKLYISTTCPSCKETIPYFIAKDREGKLWQPVIVPNSALLKGEKYIRRQGYQGSVYSASSSPSHKVPCLQNGETVVSGTKEVIIKAKEIFAEAN